MTMKRWMSVAFLVFGLTAFAGTRPARACGGGYVSDSDSLAILAGLAAVTVDLPFTVGDMIQAGTDHPPTAAYGGLEMAATLPQVALMTYGAVHAYQQGDSTAGNTFLVLAGWVTVLAGHGLAAIINAPAARPTNPEPPARHAALEWNLAPAMVSAGQARAAPGAVVFGRF
jgi:hypothetical protein